MATKLVQDTSLTSVANAIRVKAEISGTLEFPDGFVSAIQNLSPSGNDYVVTLSWDTQDEMWTIDKTYAEAYAAYQAGKTLTTNVDATDFSDGIVVGSKIWFDNDFNHFWLDITWGSDTEVFGGGKRQVYGLSSLDGYYFAETHDILLYPQFESPSRIYTPTTSTQTETITYDASDDYNGIDHVSVTVNPIPSQYIVPSGTKTITENGTYDVTNFASADVNVSGGGGGASVPPKEVNFYDYDGTVVDAYTASEFAALSAMPANPSHDGLTAQGWNWSLADAKAYVAKYGRLNIGQMYVTTSGDTEIDIQLGIGRNKPYLGCCPNGTVEIDWGDGSAHDTLTGTSTTTLQSIQHTYPDTGEPFTITLHMESGSLGFIGSSSSSTGSQIIYNGTTGQTNGQRAYQNAVKEVRCGSNVTSIDTYAFQNCYSLSLVTIPESVTSIGNNVLQYCYSLASVTIPESVTSIGSNAFQYCYSLASVTIPESVTNIDTYAFQYCHSLASVSIPESVTNINRNAFTGCSSLSLVMIPEGVTSIGSNAFQNCYSLAHLIFEPTTPPTAGTNAFAGLPSDLVVYVPAGTLSAYQSASNYSSIASYMVEMSA